MTLTSEQLEQQKALFERAEELGIPTSAPLWFYTRQVTLAAEQLGTPDDVLALSMIEWLQSFGYDDPTRAYPGMAIQTKVAE